MPPSVATGTGRLISLPCGKSLEDKQVVHRSAARLPRRRAAKTRRPLLAAAASALACTSVALQSRFVFILVWVTCKRGANYRQLHCSGIRGGFGEGEGGRWLASLKVLRAENKKREMKSSSHGNIFLLVSFESVLTGFTGTPGKCQNTLRLTGSRFIRQESHWSRLQLATWETEVQPRGLR